MKTKNFLVSGLVGGIVYFVLGWLSYEVLLKDVFPQEQEMTMEWQTYLLIFLACLAYALFVAYIFTKWSQITKVGTGFKAGAVIGLFLGLHWNLFHLALMKMSLDLAALDTTVCIITTALTGAVVALVNGKMN